MSILQGTIPSDWEGEFCRYAVCWPNSPQWLAVLRGVLVLPSRGRFWDEHTGNIITAQEVIRQTYDQNLHLEEVIMACNDTALQQIAAALMLLAQNTGHCCADGPPANGGVQIIVEVGPDNTPTPLYGSVPPTELPSDEVPPDYPGTLEEFQADQCRTANQFVSNWADSIRALAHINFAASAGLTIVISAALVGLIVLPEFLIPVLIAACIVLVIGEEAWFSLADAIEANRDSIVCAIITSEGTVEAFKRISDIVTTIIEALSLSSVKGAALRIIALVLINTDTLNYLYSFGQGQGPEADCGACVCTLCLHRLNAAGGTIAERDVGGGWAGVIAEFSEGAWNIIWDVADSSVKIEWRNLTGYTPTGFSEDDFRIGQSVAGDVFSGNTFADFQGAANEACLTPPVSPVGQWFVRSSTTITVEIKTSEC